MPGKNIVFDEFGNMLTVREVQVPGSPGVIKQVVRVGEQPLGFTYLPEGMPIVFRAGHRPRRLNVAFLNRQMED